MGRRTKIILISLSVLVLLIGCAWYLRKIRGEKALAAALARAEQMGISTELVDYQRPALPPGQDLLQDDAFLKEWDLRRSDYLNKINNTKLPSLKSQPTFRHAIQSKGEYRDYRHLFDEVLTEEEAEAKLFLILEPYRQRVETLAEILQHYPPQSFYQAPEPGTQRESQILIAKRLAEAFRDHALLAARRNLPEKTIQLLHANQRLSELSSEIGIIQPLVSLAVRSLNDEVIWEGLRLRIWNTEQLRELTALVASRDIEERFLEGLKQEVAYSFNFYKNPDSDLSFSHGLSRWQRLKNRFRRSIEGSVPYPFSAFDTARWIDAHLDFLEGLTALDQDWEPSWRAQQQDRGHPTWVIESVAQTLTSVIERNARFKTKKRLVLLALWLELHFQEHGSYPATVTSKQTSFPLQDLTDPSRRDLQYTLHNDRPKIWSEHHKAERRSPFRWQYTPDDLESWLKRREPQNPQRKKRKRRQR